MEKFILKDKLNPEILKIIEDVNLYAKKTGVKIYFVGGIVRDLLMDVKVSDTDIVIESDAISFCKGYEDYEKGCCEILSTHPDFGTCKMKINNIIIDFASTREETYPQSGCLPVVKNIGCLLKNDVLRRDFTINSIAIDLETGGIIDYLDGIDDLKEKKLKILHPKSFIDDPTRILRALDFSLRFDFTIDDETKKIQNEFLEKFSQNRGGLSQSRVDLTLNKLFSNGCNAQMAYKKIVEEKFYKIFQDEKPEIEPEKLQDAINIFRTNPHIVYFRAAKNDIPAPVTTGAKNNFEIYKTFVNFTNEDLALYYALNADKNALKFNNELKNIKTNITGDDILKLGIKQGKIIGEIFEKLLEIKLNSPETAPKNFREEILFVEKNFITK